MTYLFETELSEKKYIYYSLQKIYGLNKSQTIFICKTLGYSVNLKIKLLTKEQLSNLIKFIEHSSFIINNDLKKLNYKIFQNLINIKSYRGLRRLNNLPVRGQRTHTNAKTVKKKFKIVSLKVDND